MLLFVVVFLGKGTFGNFYILCARISVLNYVMRHCVKKPVLSISNFAEILGNKFFFQNFARLVVVKRGFTCLRLLDYTYSGL